MPSHSIPDTHIAGRIISLDPLITYSAANRAAPLGLLSVAPDLLGDRKGLHLLHHPWSLETGHATWVAASIAGAKRDFPQSRFVMMTSNEMEGLVYGASGQECIVGNASLLTDERVWRPHPRRPGPTYDAVYVARLDPSKRHELAQQIERVELIYGRSLEDGGGIDAVRAVLPHAHFANDESGKYQRLSPEDVAIRLAQADVGLCLSAEEGMMRASIEYLLAGLPVVSTPSVGGRDRYYVGAYCRIAEPDPHSIARAVAELRARNFDRRLVRAHVGELLAFERYNFIGTLNALVKSTFDIERMFNDLDAFIGAASETISTANLYAAVAATVHGTLAPGRSRPAATPLAPPEPGPAPPGERKPDHEPRFVAIIGKARSGTNLLRSLLRQEAWIDCVDEVFNDTTQASLQDHFGPFLARSIGSRTAFEPSGRAVSEILDGYFAHLRSRHRGQKTTLVDVKEEELRILDWPSIRLSDPPRLLTYMRDHGFRFIRLRRRNLLAQLASLKLALATQVWVRSTAAAPKPQTPAKVRIDLETLLNEFEWREREEALVDRWLGNSVPSLTLYYEDLSAADGGLADGPRARLNQFLGRPLSVGIVARTQKLAPPLSELIENYDEVARVLTGTQYERFLH